MVGPISVVTILGGAIARGTVASSWPPFPHTHSCFPCFPPFPLRIPRSFPSSRVRWTAFLVNSPRTSPSGRFIYLSAVPHNLTNRWWEYRIQLGSESPSIWTPLHELWGTVTRAQSAEIGLDGQHMLLVLSLAKFTRNIVAEVPPNQKNAL